MHLFEIISAMRPMTVRQVFYQATVPTSSRSQRPATPRCRPISCRCAAPARCPTIGSRTTRGGSASRIRFSGVQEALEETARLYRKALWADADAYVEVWLEKDALAGVVYPISSKYDVPLMVARGYASLSFLHSAAEYIGTLDVPTYIYHFGDFDPSGVNAGEKIEETLMEMAPDAEINFERIAVTPEQISGMGSAHPADENDRQSRARNSATFSVELDAIQPDALRDLVEAGDPAAPARPNSSKS